MGATLRTGGLRRAESGWCWRVEYDRWICAREEDISRFRGACGRDGDRWSDAIRTECHRCWFGRLRAACRVPHHHRLSSSDDHVCRIASTFGVAPRGNDAPLLQRWPLDLYRGRSRWTKWAFPAGYGRWQHCYALSNLRTRTRPLPDNGTNSCIGSRSWRHSVSS